mmetsp:Transcript_20886/g.27088  ORF Transcript_20886/g.27088 Transcript_20886/m.27088 type:complete len:351 (+) Transcript_20886:63-1115(+)
MAYFWWMRVSYLFFPSIIILLLKLSCVKGESVDLNLLSRDQYHQKLQEDVLEIDESENPVAFSSQRMAASRAIENLRDDRLFEDPISHILAGEKAMLLAKEKYESNQGLSKRRNISIRTRYFDDFLEDKCNKNDIKQVVILGAGMDSRAFRLNLPEGCTIFEVDQEVVLSVKQQKLEKVTDKFLPKSKRVPVSIDFTKNELKSKLLRAGFSNQIPSIWIVEGVTMYLTESENLEMFESIHSICAPNSFIGVSLVNKKSIENAQNSESLLMQQWKWGSDDPKEYIEDHCLEWKVQSVVSLGTPGTYPDGANYAAYDRILTKEKGVSGGKVMYVIILHQGNAGKGPAGDLYL